jgi:hypothetical protein
MRVKVVAFNADGYQKVIAVFDEQQIRMTDGAVDTNDMAIISAGLGVGVSIDPKQFPEMVKFVVVCEGR